MLKKALTTTLTKYIKGGVAKSVKRNSHMNDAGKITEKDAIKILDAFLCELEDLTTSYMIAMDTVHHLIDQYKFVFRPQTACTEEVDAVVVDFINFYAGQYCIDLALYTRDVKPITERIAALKDNFVRDFGNQPAVLVLKIGNDELKKDFVFYYNTPDPRKALRNEYAFYDVIWDRGYSEEDILICGEDMKVVSNKDFKYQKKVT